MFLFNTRLNLNQVFLTFKVAKINHAGDVRKSNIWKTMTNCWIVCKNANTILKLELLIQKFVIEPIWTHFGLYKYFYLLSFLKLCKAMVHVDLIISFIHYENAALVLRFVTENNSVPRKQGGIVFFNPLLYAELSPI